MIDVSHVFLFMQSEHAKRSLDTLYYFNASGGSCVCLTRAWRRTSITPHGAFIARRATDLVQLGTIFALSNAFKLLLLEYDEAGAAPPSNGVGGSDVDCEEALGEHYIVEQGCAMRLC